ncbi:hypothetical protein, partial [Sphingomonas sp. Leaf33]|uniref:hypothetical protein n=1 Tax=Sphingomonas sp. Leaf33 TaxID=1736215 RepID=UPI00138F5968
FRAEIAAAVRSTSPFLSTLLEANGSTLDQASFLIKPAPGWPLRPRMSGNSLLGLGGGRHFFRNYLASLASGGGVKPPVRGDSHGYSFFLNEGGWARVQIVGHSLEIDAEIGPLRFETRFGALRIELDRGLPETLAVACIGRPVDEVIDHESLRGHGWRIIEVDPEHPPYFRQTLVIATGSVGYRMPWWRNNS